MRAMIFGLALVAMAPGLAAAQERCDPVDDLTMNAATPRMFIVSPDQPRLHFSYDCGQADGPCGGRAYLVPGNLVVVTGRQDGFACATYVGKAPGYTTTSGWLPLASLEAILPRPDFQSWQAAWRDDKGRRLRISARSKSQLSIRARLPERGAKRIASRIAPRQAGHLAFSLDRQGEARPYGAGGPDACRMQMWQMPPYLVVADNGLCGEPEPGFTGVYRRVDQPRRGD